MSTSTPSGPAPGQATPPEPSARERFEWIRKNTRILLAALVLLLIALGVVVFSSALFTSSSANPGNLAASGIMDQSNDLDGEAILTAEQLLPGDSAEGAVTISNVGDADGAFTLTASNLVDDPVDPAFSEVLTLTISDGSEAVWNGPLADVDSEPIALGTWAAGEEHTYTFSVTFAAGSTNEYQDAQTTLDFTWDAIQS
jgi:hypothetical protein